MWSYQLHDTLSGAFRLEVHPSSARWRTVVTEPGDGSFTLQLRDEEHRVPRDIARAETLPWARTLVVCWDGVPMFAGLISSRKYNKTTGELECTMVELAWVLRKRWPHTMGEFSPGTEYSLASRSFKGLIRSLVRTGTFRTEAEWPGPGREWWNLPIDYPADESGPYSLKWWHYQKLTVRSMLDEVASMNGAPDWYLRPYFTSAGALRWELQVGTPRIPGRTIEIPDAEHTPVTNATVLEDGLDQIDGVIGLGQGSEADVLWAKQGADGEVNGRLWLDEFISEGTISDQAQLQRIVTGYQQDRHTLHSEWGLDVVADELPPASSGPILKIGDVFKVWSYGDEFIPDGATQLTVMAVSGDLSHVLKPEVI